MRCLTGGLLCVLLLGCSSSSSPDARIGADAAVTSRDGAPPGADAAAPDGGAADATPSSLGRVCVTTADGGPGSCPDAICCSAGGTTICTLPSDCPSGTGYKACSASSECQGSICCQLGVPDAAPSMTFCTKPAACSAYHGTVLP